MPFTPSHAVVALAFTRTPLVPAAVAVGAMAPDLPLFVRTGVLTYAQTHASPLVAVSVAAVLLMVWWLIVRPAARELAPSWLAARLPEGWDDGAARTLRSVRPGSALAAAGIVIVSLAIGALTHVAWDAFTHEGRWGVELLPALGRAWGPLPGYRWLQYGSSLVGLGGLAVAGALWLRGRRAEQAPRVFPAAVRTTWWLSLPGALVAAWIIGVAQYGPFTAEWTAQHLAYRVLPPACAVWAAGTLVLCVSVQVVRARRRGASAA